MSQAKNFTAQDCRIISYTVAAGAGLLAAGGAYAELIDANVNETVSAGPIGDFDSVLIDVDNDGTDDFEFSVDTGFSDYQGYCGAVQLENSNFAGSSVELGGTTAYAAPIAAGTPIGETTDFQIYDGRIFTNCIEFFGQTGDYELGERGFVGFRLPDGSGGFNYGYFDVEVQSNGEGFRGDGGIGDRPVLTGIIHGAFLEDDPDTTIPAGTPITPPVPAVGVPIGGAAPLGLLLFAAGAAALRRRNRATA